MFESPKFHQLTEEIDKKLTEAFDYVTVSCRKYFDIMSSTDVGQETQLDIERRRFCFKEMVSSFKQLSSFTILCYLRH